jgi:hypothetical protein
MTTTKKADKTPEKTDEELLAEHYDQPAPAPKQIAVTRDDQTVTVTIDGKTTELTADEVHTLRTMLDTVYMELS